MVNIVDAFTRLYQRPPTESELGAMLKLQADRDAEKRPQLRPPRKLIDESPASQKRSKDAALDRPLKEAITVNFRGWAINCMLEEGFSKEKIGHILCITEEQIDYNINRYKLPRELIKPRG